MSVYWNNYATHAGEILATAESASSASAPSSLEDEQGEQPRFLSITEDLVPVYDVVEW